MDSNVIDTIMQISLTTDHVFFGMMYAYKLPKLSFQDLKIGSRLLRPSHHSFHQIQNITELANTSSICQACAHIHDIELGTIVVQNVSIMPLHF